MNKPNTHNKPHKLNKLLQDRPNDLLSLYVTAGFPRIDSTQPILRALLNEDGVDLIELGFPFSDPLADGPVIQRSSERALANGMSLEVLFTQLSKLHAEIEASPKPILLMGYFNPVLQFGVERFCVAAATAGISGIILPDLPVEIYAEQYQSMFEAHGLAFVPIVTPATPEPRLRRIDALANGFLYVVATPGITGSRAGVDAEKSATLARMRNLGLRNPLLVGFGIHDAASFERACEHTAGAIVGTAFIEALEGVEDVSAGVRTFARSIRQGGDVGAA